MSRPVSYYGSCPVCTYWSLGIDTSGRVVRHTYGFGSVENSKPVKLGIWKVKICPGSGKLIGEPGPRLHKK